MNPISIASIKFFPTAAAAEALAVQNREGDDGSWSYVVVELPRGFAVEVRDEDGHRVAFL